jgi:Mannosyltransferase (PIG-M)
VIGMARLDPLTRAPLKHVALGVVIRELLAPWTGHPYDFEIWIRLGFYMQNLVNPYGRLPYVQGLSFSPFATTGSISYPPFSAFIFALTYRLYALLGQPSRFLYYFILKQPMVWADVGTAIVLAKIILSLGDKRSARTALLVWLYFPLGIIISSMWGQLDPISLFLSLLAIYFFLVSKWLPSAAMLGFAIYLKTLPIVFLPVFLMQSQVKSSRLGYSLVSLVIPIAGTLVPALAFNWGYAMYNNLSFQVAIPLEGAMSVLGLAYYALPLVSLALYVTGSIWIPVLLATYVYIWKKGLPLFHGLLIVILAFSISRPFLPEQWSLYPLALLLLVQTRENMGHFLGLASSSTVFLAFNNGLLVRFFTPVSVGAFNWDIFVDPSPYVALWVVIRSLLALLYFTESFLVIRGRESIVYRVVLSVRPDWSLQRRHVSPTEVGHV